MRNFVLAVFFVCLLPGCGGSGTPTVEQPIPETTERPKDKPMEIRDSLEGRWEFELVRELSALPIALIDVVKDGDAWTVKSAIDIPVADAPKFKSGTASAKSIEMSFDVGPVGLVYTGQLKNGIVRGSVVFDAGNVVIGMMLPSDLKVLGSPQPKPLRYLTDFQTIGRADDPAARLKEFVEEYPDSALALDGFQKWLLFAKKNEFGSDEISAMVAQFRESARFWGEPRLQMVPLDVAVRLSSQGYQPELAAKFLSEFRDSMTEEQKQQEQLTSVVKSVDASIQFAQNIKDLTSGNAESEGTAVQRLGDVLQDNPVNGRAILALADYYRDKSELDNAIKYYARLIAIPTLERTIVDEIIARDPSASLPSQQLTELWKKRDGNLSGLDNYLNQVYRETFAAFIKDQDRHAARADGENKVAMLELLTGAQCAPCVAADLTLNVLGDFYEDSELIVLRYHQHIPGPDPLTNIDSRKRFTYYNAKGTPSVFLNGNQLGGVAGSLDQLNIMLPAMHGMIEKAIAEKLEIAFDMKAANDGEKISIAASVSNVDDSDGGEYYLRLVLAENDIVYRAPNGIRIHDMVARAMPGGYRGLLVKDGKAEFSGDVSIAELKEAVNDELDMIEQHQNSRMPDRPLDFAKLRLVAMVQDDVDRRVVQSHVIDVTNGKAPDSTDTAADASAETAKESATATEKPAAPSKPAAEVKQTDEASVEKTGEETVKNKDKTGT